MHTNLDRITMLTTLSAAAVGLILFLVGGMVQNISVTVAGMLTGVIGMTIPALVSCGKAIHQWQRHLEWRRTG